MPYIPNSENDDENKNPAQGIVSPAGGGGAHLSPNGGVGSSNTSPTPSAPAAGGNFATLQTYLNANQGQAEPLAGKITAGIGKQYDTLAGQNQSTLSDINSQVTNAPGYTASNPDVMAQEAANPVSFSGDQNNVKAFQSLLNNTYGGPTSAETTAGYQGQQAAVNNAISQGNAATQTDAGRRQLLTQNEARPTTGVTALNSAILTQDPNSLSKVQNAYQPFSNLLTGLSSGAQGINATIGKEQADATASSAAANKAIADQSQGLQTALQSGVSAAQDKANKAAALSNSLSSVNATGYSALSADQLAALGITPAQAAHYDAAYGLLNTAAPQTYLGAVPAPVSQGSLYTAAPAGSAPTMANTATADQYALDSALAKLAGPSLYTNALDPSQAAEAGTFAPGTPTFNTAAASGQLSNAQKVANFLAGYNPQLNSSNPAQYNTYNPNFNYTTPSHSNLLNYLNQIMTQTGTQGRYGTEQQAIDDILNGKLG